MNNKAFTLIEILVVMVIASALVVITIPPLLNQIKRNQGQEAIRVMAQIKDAMEVWGGQNSYRYDILDTNDPFKAIGMTNPSQGDGNGTVLNAASKFNYIIQTTSLEDGLAVYGIRATDFNGVDYIQEYKHTDGKMVCFATGAHQGGNCGYDG